MEKKFLNSVGIELRKAAAAGNLELVQRYCRKEIINVPSSNGRTALHWSVVNGHTRIIQYLLNYDVSYDLPDKEGNTPLHLAAQLGNSKAVLLLIQKGAGEKNILNKKGLSPLDYSMRGEHSFITRELLRFKRPNIKLGHKEETSKLLFERYVAHNTNVVTDPSLKDYLFDTVPGNEGKIFPYFQPGNKFTLLEMQEAVKRNILHIRKEFGAGTLLHSAAVSQVDVLAKFRWLLDEGVDPNSQISEINALGFKNTAAHSLIANEAEGLAIELIKMAHALEGNRKLNLNLKDSEGKTLLCITAKVGLVDLANTLIDLKADPNIPDHKGDTPLHYALLLGRNDIADKLISYQADTTSKNKQGLTAFDWLKTSNEEDVRDCLVSICIDPDRKLTPKSSITYIESCMRARQLRLIREEDSQVKLHSLEKKSEASVSAERTSPDIKERITRESLCS